MSQPRFTQPRFTQKSYVNRLIRLIDRLKLKHLNKFSKKCCNDINMTEETTGKSEGKCLL